MKYFYETDINTLEDCVNGRFVANIGRSKYTLIDKIGRVYDMEYCSIKPRPEGFFVVQDKMFGPETLIDKFGKVICSNCKDIDFFSDDGIAVIEKQDGSKRWITKQGEEFGEQFKSIGCFSGGYGCVKLDDGSWTYVDKNLNPVGFSFEGVHPFTHDSEYSWVKMDGKYFVINKQFELQSGPYDHILYMEDNDVLVVKKDKPEEDKNVYAYYNINGVQLGDDYKAVYGFSNGIGMADTGSGHVYIDLDGKQIGNRTFKMARSFGENMAVVGEFDENGEHTFTFLRRDGSLFSQWYPAINEETEGLGAVMIGNKYFYIDVDERLYGKGSKSLGLFHEGISNFYYRKGKYKYLTRDLKPFDEEFDTARCFSEGVGVVKDDEKFDAINKNHLMLSQISMMAQKVEESPEIVLNLSKEVLADTEISYLLYEHAVMVIEFKLASGGFGDEHKVSLESLKNQLSKMMKRIEKDVPVYGPREFYMF